MRKSLSIFLGSSAQPRLGYLVTRSQDSAESFLVSRFTSLTDLRQRVRHIFSKWLQTRADESLARLMLVSDSDAENGCHLTSRVLPAVSFGPPSSSDQPSLLPNSQRRDRREHSRNVCRGRFLAPHFFPNPSAKSRIPGPFNTFIPTIGRSPILTAKKVHASSPLPLYTKSKIAIAVKREAVLSFFNCLYTVPPTRLRGLERLAPHATAR